MRVLTRCEQACGDERRRQHHVTAKGKRRQKHRDQQKPKPHVGPAVGFDLVWQHRTSGSIAPEERGEILRSGGQCTIGAATAFGHFAQSLGGKRCCHRLAGRIRNRLARSCLQGCGAVSADAQHVNAIACLACRARGALGRRRVLAGIVRQQNDPPGPGTGIRQHLHRPFQRKVRPVAQNRHQAGGQFRQHFPDHRAIAGQRGRDKGAVGIDHQPGVAAFGHFEDIAQFVPRTP